MKPDAHRRGQQLAWLQAQSCFPKLLWKGSAFAGIATAFSTLPPLIDQRLFGWRHFRPSDAPEWRTFPSEFYFRPLYEWSGEEGVTIAANSDHSLPAYAPDFPTWAHWIKERPVKKVVLARRASFSSSLTPLQWAALTEPTFFIQTDPHTAFFGKPPEHLYRRKGRYIESEAVAGTQLIGEPHTAKDRSELDYIEAALKEALTPLVRNLSFSSITTREAGEIHHLCRTCFGLLHDEVTDDDLLKALHPTPAVGGWPRAEALDYISSCEPFQRGLYAAPVGWIAPEGAEWLVAIRSALLDGPTLHLYSGAGIVDGSQADQEWQELDRKLSWITRSF